MDRKIKLLTLLDLAARDALECKKCYGLEQHIDKCIQLKILKEPVRKELLEYREAHL